MKLLRCLIVSAIFLFQISCESFQKKDSLSEIEKVQKIEIGADVSKVENILGKPTEIESLENGRKFSFFINYKGQKIPKILIWLDESNQVLAKHINLISEGGITKKQLVELLGMQPSDFATSENKGHFISMSRTLEDREKGISLEVIQSRGDRVQSVSWFDPKSDRLPSNK